MIGTVPVTRLAPLEYRYALDATMAIIADVPTPLVQCNLSELENEVRQRIPAWTTTEAAGAGLWIEPRERTWNAELHMFQTKLAHGAPLVVIASRPLARMLPERRAWENDALGLHLRGLTRVCGALRNAGFGIHTQYGMHSIVVIGINMLGNYLERCGRPDLGDRLHFAGRLRYCTTGPTSMLSTVALLVGHKERD